jgi:hypothetical protein
MVRKAETFPPVTMGHRRTLQGLLEAVHYQKRAWSF